jgi:hypothetical protein
VKTLKIKATIPEVPAKVSSAAAGAPSLLRKLRIKMAGGINRKPHISLWQLMLQGMTLNSQTAKQGEVLKITMESL